MMNTVETSGATREVSSKPESECIVLNEDDAQVESFDSNQQESFKLQNLDCGVESMVHKKLDRDLAKLIYDLEMYRDYEVQSCTDEKILGLYAFAI